MPVVAPQVLLCHNPHDPTQINSGFHLSVFQTADKLIRTFAEQIFYTGFIHADPHPGNGRCMLQPCGSEACRRGEISVICPFSTDLPLTLFLCTALCKCTTLFILYRFIHFILSVVLQRNQVNWMVSGDIYMYFLVPQCWWEKGLIRRQNWYF